MRLFLQVNIGSWQTQSYEKPFLSYASSLASDIIGTDMDSQSDPYVVELVTKLYLQAQSVFLFIIADPEQPLGTTNSLFNKILRNTSKLSHIILKGSHEHVNAFFRGLPHKFTVEEDEDAIKSLVKKFAQSADQQESASH